MGQGVGWSAIPRKYMEPNASPGVIGDWTEHERAEKQRRESEKRRYKSMGWNVDFGDDD